MRTSSVGTMSLQYQVKVILPSGEEVNKTLSFETASSVTLHGLRQQLGFSERDGDLQLFNPAYNDFQTLKTEKDIAILKNDSTFRLLKKVSKKEMKKEKDKEKKDKKEKDKRKDKDKKKDNKESALFGVDLAELVEREASEKQIPRFLVKVIEWLRVHGIYVLPQSLMKNLGLKEEGLFRISGGQTEVDDLKNEFEKGLWVVIIIDIA